MKNVSLNTNFNAFVPFKALTLHSTLATVISFIPACFSLFEKFDIIRCISVTAHIIHRVKGLLKLFFVVTELNVCKPSSLAQKSALKTNAFFNLPRRLLNHPICQTKHLAIVTRQDFNKL